MGLCDHELDVVNRVDIALIVDDDLDHFGTEVNVLTNSFAHFVARISEKIFWGREILLLGLQVKLSTVNRNDDAGIDHRRAEDPTSVNGVAERRIRVVARITDIANGGETGLQHGLAVSDTLDG